jgi:hypothetical protein
MEICITCSPFPFVGKLNTRRDLTDMDAKVTGGGLYVCLDDVE